MTPKAKLYHQDMTSVMMQQLVRHQQISQAPALSLDGFFTRQEAFRQLCDGWRLLGEDAGWQPPVLKEWPEAPVGPPAPKFSPRYERPRAVTPRMLGAFAVCLSLR